MGKMVKNDGFRGFIAVSLWSFNIAMENGP